MSRALTVGACCSIILVSGVCLMLVGTAPQPMPQDAWLASLAVFSLLVASLVLVATCAPLVRAQGELTGDASLVAQVPSLLPFGGPDMDTTVPAAPEVELGRRLRDLAADLRALEAQEMLVPLRDREDLLSVALERCADQVDSGCERVRAALHASVTSPGGFDPGVVVNAARHALRAGFGEVLQPRRQPRAAADIAVVTEGADE